MEGSQIAGNWVYLANQGAQVVVGNQWVKNSVLFDSDQLEYSSVLQM
jgi:hypothetical protein